MIEAVRERDAAWEPRCQHAYVMLASKRWPSYFPERWVTCDRPEREHPMRYVGEQYDHDFVYVPDMDTSAEADRRRLLTA